MALPANHEGRPQSFCSVIPSASGRSADHHSLLAKCLLHVHPACWRSLPEECCTCALQQCSAVCRDWGSCNLLPPALCRAAAAGCELERARVLHHHWHCSTCCQAHCRTQPCYPQGWAHSQHMRCFGAPSFLQHPRPGDRCMPVTPLECPSQRAPSCSSLRPHTGLIAPTLGALSIDPTMQTYEVPFDCRYLPYQWALLMRALASWKAWKQGWRQRTAAYWRPGAQVRAMQPPAMCLVASCLPRLDDDIIMVLPSHLIRERCARHSSNALLCRAANITLPCRTLQVACWNSSRGITQTAVGSLQGALCVPLLLVLLPDATPDPAAATMAPARPGCPSAQPGLQPTGGHSHQPPGVPEIATARCCRTGTGSAHMMACTRTLGRHGRKFHKHSTTSQSTLTRSAPCRSSGSRGKPRRH